jgi:predicted acyltransferase
MKIELFPPSVPGNSGSASGSSSIQRIVSIDIVRALTMVLMIFVNDLWTLKDVPAWLGHAERGVDGIGLADVVFPAFLFIVGLSLPFAVNNRRKKGDNEWQLIKHILLRSLALIIMGVFLVNGETYNAEATGMVRVLWYPLCCLSFILIWNSYPGSSNKYLVWAGRIAGIVTLLILSIVYRGGDTEHIRHFSPQWWGILGLIGWAYLAAGLITVISKNNFYVILSGWVFFCILSMVYKAGFIPRDSILSFVPGAILGGTLTGLTMGGVLTSYIFRYFANRNDNKLMTIVLVLFSALLVILSVITRPYWGLAKLGATPAWLFLCSAFTILTFLAVYWIADVAGKAKWFNFIKPAGTATLLCYLIPYFFYAIRTALHLQLPEGLRTDGIGLIKSILFALLCTVSTGVLIRIGFRLKL